VCAWCAQAESGYLVTRRGANTLALRAIADLRIENERLRAELDAARGASLASPPREA